jgi:uncharacterized SAM-dependent methyltransferase
LKYFKNTDLAKLYNVSEKSVRNWIESAEQGKLDLQLHTQNGKAYIANVTKNTAALDRLVEERRKYRNMKAVKTVTPQDSFYKIYSEDQIHDIITNLEINHEIPRQYNYFDGGAYYWDKYTQRLSEEDAPNLLNRTIKLLEINQVYLDELLSQFKRVNVIDVGVGNAYPVKEFLEHLLATGKLGRYIALDISPDMLQIAQDNVRKWFGNKVDFEAHELDINYERFSKILTSEYVKKDSKDAVNLVLLLGGTLSNSRTPDCGFRMIHESMGINDILIHSIKLDSEATRRYFDFNSEPSNTNLSPNHRLIFDLFNIDDSLYEVEMGYDEKLRERYIRIRLNVALNIRFSLPNGERIVELNKGSTILLWRALQQTADEVKAQFGRSGFYMLQTSQTDDQEYLLTISKIARPTDLK